MPMMPPAGDPAMMGAPAVAPEDPAAGMEMPEDVDPGELAAILGGLIGEQRQQAHMAVDAMAEQQVEQVIQMVIQGAAGAQTIDGMGVAA